MKEICRIKGLATLSSKNTVTLSIQLPQISFQHKPFLYINGKIRYNISKNLYKACVALDLSKASESLSRPIVCRKLEHIDFNMNAISFFRDFLTNRIQCVCLNESKSDWLNVKQRVPPGTILRVFFLSLYMNDFTIYCNQNTEIIQNSDVKLIFGKPFHCKRSHRNRN